MIRVGMYVRAKSKMVRLKQMEKKLLYLNMIFRQMIRGIQNLALNWAKRFIRNIRQKI